MLVRPLAVVAFQLVVVAVGVAQEPLTPEERRAAYERQLTAEVNAQLRAADSRDGRVAFPAVDGDQCGVHGRAVPDSAGHLGLVAQVTVERGGGALDTRLSDTVRRSMGRAREIYKCATSRPSKAVDIAMGFWAQQRDRKARCKANTGLLDK